MPELSVDRRRGPAVRRALRSAARSVSSGSFASARRGFARTCSSRSARRCSCSSPRTRSDELLASGDGDRRVDPTRIAAQIVTGIGFLGAGAIIRQGLTVRGLTTAATLWLVAGIGMACGRRLLGGGVHRDHRGARHAVAAAHRRAPAGDANAADRRAAPRRRAGGGQGAAPVLAALEGLGGTVSQFQLEARGPRARRDRGLPEQVQASKVVGRLAELEYVTGVRWADYRAARLVEEREQAPRAEARASRTGSWSCSTRTGTRPRTARRTTTTRSARRASAAEHASEMGVRRGLGDRGRGARRAAGRRSRRAGRTTAVGRRCSRRSRASRTGARATSCELVALSPDGRGAPRDRHARGRDRARAARAARGSATTRSSCRTARRAPSPSSGTSGRPSTRTAHARRARSPR